MLNPVIFDDFILYNEQNKDDFFILKNNFTRIAGTGWRNCGTAKNFIFLKNNLNNEKYYLVSKYMNNGKELTDNPYYPVFFQNKTNEFLISESGIVKNKNGEILPYYWAKYIENSCLLDLKDNNINNIFFTKYLKQQKQNSFYSTNSINQFNKLILTKTNERQILNEIKNLKTKIFKGKNPEFLVSFSQGDLWGKDVFYLGEDNFKIIDWEWFCEDVPIGIDILDFLYAEEEGTGIELFKRFLDLEGFNIFRQSNFIADYTYRCNLLAFFIYRYFARFIIQDGITVIEDIHNKNIIQFAETLLVE